MSHISIQVQARISINSERGISVADCISFVPANNNIHTTLHRLFVHTNERYFISVRKRISTAKVFTLNFACHTKLIYEYQLTLYIAPVQCDRLVCTNINLKYNSCNIFHDTEFMKFLSCHRVHEAEFMKSGS